MRSTDKNFEVREVMGDKAYLSLANLRLVSEVGATPLIPFKSNSKARYNEEKIPLLRVGLQPGRNPPLF